MNTRVRMDMIKRLKEADYKGSYLDAFNGAKRWLQRLEEGGEVDDEPEKWVPDNTKNVYYNRKTGEYIYNGLRTKNIRKLPKEAKLPFIEIDDYDKLYNKNNTIKPNSNVIYNVNIGDSSAQSGGIRTSHGGKAITKKGLKDTLGYLSMLNMVPEPASQLIGKAAGLGYMGMSAMEANEEIEKSNYSNALYNIADITLTGIPYVNKANQARTLVGRLIQGIDSNILDYAGDILVNNPYTKKSGEFVIRHNNKIIRGTDLLNTAKDTKELYNRNKYAQGGSVTQLGYKDISPYRNEPSNTIQSNQITMDGVSQDLIGYGFDEMGRIVSVKEMKANSGDYSFPGASKVVEVPRHQNGGEYKWKPGSQGVRKAQPDDGTTYKVSASSYEKQMPDSYMTKMNRDYQNYNPAYPASGRADYVPVEAMMLPGTPVIKGLGKVGNFVLDAINPLSGMRNPYTNLGLVKGAKPIGVGATLTTEQLNNAKKMFNPEWDSKQMMKTISKDEERRLTKEEVELLNNEYQRQGILETQKNILPESFKNRVYRNINPNDVYGKPSKQIGKLRDIALNKGRRVVTNYTNRISKNIENNVAFRNYLGLPADEYKENIYINPYLSTNKRIVFSTNTPVQNSLTLGQPSSPISEGFKKSKWYSKLDPDDINFNSTFNEWNSRNKDMFLVSDVWDLSPSGVNLENIFPFKKSSWGSVFTKPTFANELSKHEDILSHPQFSNYFPQGKENYIKTLEKLHNDIPFKRYKKGGSIKTNNKQ